MMTLTLENATFIDFCGKALMTGRRKSGNLAQQIFASAAFVTHIMGPLCLKEDQNHVYRMTVKERDDLTRQLVNFMLVFFCKICSHWK